MILQKIQMIDIDYDKMITNYDRPQNTIDQYWLQQNDYEPGSHTILAESGSPVLSDVNEMEQKW